ncbi:MAG TPA: thiamine phosphate synthase [Acidimicrobiales bacterium]|nr:thiamine phosphate synthase [Acidimicrobiales bacterium]
MFDLTSRRLYLCVGWRADLVGLVADVVGAGVDVVQLREKVASPDAVLATARELAPLCADLGVPFLVNDDPELAALSGADGVHVGQEDATVTRCRELLGDEALIGLSTHDPAQFAAALATSASYVSAGPIEPTPTKPGRPGTGLAYALDCQRASDRPVFVTGGVRADTVGALVAAGLRHFVVVRAILDAPNPEFAARQLREAIDMELIRVNGTRDS